MTISDQTPGASRHFYVVSIKKFVLLTFFTMGGYQVYWIYKNWAFYKAATGEKIWPVPRGLFFIFFVNSLYRKVQEKITQGGRSLAWNPSGLAAALIVVTIVDRVLTKMSGKNIGSPITDYLSFVMVGVIIAVTIPAQRAINFAESDPEGSSNSKLTGANYFWIVLGALLWLLCLVGLVAITVSPELA